jgi:lipid-A-disaccharide synthase-like uncharacterized protein
MNWTIFGFIGMFLLHASTIPVILRVSVGDLTNLPPLDMMVLVWSGLVCMTIRYHIHVRDRVAVISNSIGVLANSFIIGVILWLA